MTDDANKFGGFGGSSTSSSSSGGRSTKEYEPFNEGVAQLIFDALNATGGDIHWPLFAADAEEIDEEHQKVYSLPDNVTHYCVEQFAPFDIDAKGMGTAGKVSYEQLENSIDAGYLSESDLEDMDVEPEGSIQWAFDGVESTPQSELSHVLNGFHSDHVVNNFGAGAKVRVKIASKNEVDAAHERYTNVRFYVSRSKQAPLQRKRAELQVGELERETFEEWAQENGFGDKL